MIALLLTVLVTPAIVAGTYHFIILVDQGHEDCGVARKRHL